MENRLECLERIIKLHQLKIKELQALVKEAKKEQNEILKQHNVRHVEQL